jgi:serine/threonine-protein kinase
MSASKTDMSQGGSDGGNGSSSCVAPRTEFPATATIYQDISSAPIDPGWSTIKKVLADGWGSPFQLDPSFAINYADSCVTRRAFTQPNDAVPDCDTAPIPVPAGGNIESSKNYSCSNPGDDCHLIAYQGDRLYELYQANITGGQARGGRFSGSCLVVWDLTRDYWQPGTPFSRGDGCNGADAGGQPIAPLLLKKTEIAASAINHAMRFTLPNSKIDNTYYVHPATHLGGQGAPRLGVPYGARLRLRANYPIGSLPSAEARAIAVALQNYGMYLADGGNFFVSAAMDITDVVDTRALKALQPSDFDMVDGGPRYEFHKLDCKRTPISH